MQKSFLVASVVVLLAACGGDDNESNPRALVRVAELPAGSSCADGGQRIHTGLDLNGNGLLEDQEVKAYDDVCNPGPQRALVALVPEPAGSECAFGGSAIQTGADTNNDGELNANEVTGARYVCNPAPVLRSSTGPDQVSPTITTTAPAVASQWATSFRTTITDAVELSHGVLVNTPTGQMHFFPEGVTHFEQDSTVNIALGRSYSKMLMVVDTSGNMARKTITIQTPATGIKLGTYSVAGGRFPAGFNCGGSSAESRFGKLDGASFDTVVLGSDRIGGWGVDWSQERGYSLSVVLAGLRIGQMRAIPLQASAAEWEHMLGTYMWGLSVVMVKMRTKVAVVAGDPNRVNISLTMTCDQSSGLRVGTPYTFTATLKP